MSEIDARNLAVQVAKRLNREAPEGQPEKFFMVREETFRIVESNPSAEGCLVKFEFEGLVNYQGDPMGYLATGTVFVDNNGTMKPETLDF